MLKGERPAWPLLGHDALNTFWLPCACMYLTLWTVHVRARDCVRTHSGTFGLMLFSNLII